MSTKRRTDAWTLNSQNGIESLKFVRDILLPPLNAHEVLVKIHAASLNYRDLAITKVQRACPLSDAALLTKMISRVVKWSP